jgi:two-component system sensor histidine kinase/response regulator
MAESSETPTVDSRTVLLVEDSTTQALHFKLLLEEQGLRVEWANSGQAGVRMARRLRPDLIVLDLQMPDLNGFQVCERLKDDQEMAAIPIIMLTRHDDTEAVMLGMQMGVVDYIPKDAFADAVLIETLRQMGVIVPRAVET